MNRIYLLILLLATALPVAAVDFEDLVGELRYYNSWMAMAVYHPDTRQFMLSRTAILDAESDITLAFDFLPVEGLCYSQISVIVGLQAPLPFDLTALQPVRVQIDGLALREERVEISGSQQDFFLFFQLTDHFTPAELLAEKSVLIDLYGYGSTVFDADGMYQAMADAIGMCMEVAEAADS